MRFREVAHRLLLRRRRRRYRGFISVVANEDYSIDPDECAGEGCKQQRGSGEHQLAMPENLRHAEPDRCHSQAAPFDDAVLHIGATEQFYPEPDTRSLLLNHPALTTLNGLDSADVH